MENSVLIFLIFFLFSVQCSLAQTVHRIDNTNYDKLDMFLENEQNIVSLRIYGYSDAELPRSLLKHRNSLEKFVLGYSNITTLPTWFSEFKHLRYLNLSNNQISETHGLFEILKQNLRLEKLELYSNNINVISENISELNNLNELNLSNNPIKELSSKLTELKSLKILYLNHVFITDINTVIEDLSNICLEHISINNSALTYLPDNIINLECLKQLHLSGNNINLLPEYLVFKNMILFDLNNNPLKDVPESIIYNSNLKLLILLGTEISESRKEYLNKKMQNTAVW